MDGSLGNLEKSWAYRSFDTGVCDLLVQELGVTEATAKLLSILGKHDPKSAKRFLNPSLSHLKNPLDIPNMATAVERLVATIQKGERITVIGDYDLDGITSVAVFVAVMRELGVNVDYHVPMRTDDSCGLDPDWIQSKKLLENCDFDLIVTLDCGSNSREGIHCFKRHGVDVLVVDHHQVRVDCSDCAIVVNPNGFQGDKPESSNLCSVSLTFKLMQALVTRLKSDGYSKAEDLQLKYYLDLVAMGTITDLVPLVGENRVFVNSGLYRLGKSRHPGIQALMDVSSVDTGRSIEAADVSFRLGPRMNASGRMGDARIAVDLLLCNEYRECLKLADELDSLNQERQVIERSMFDAAVCQAEECKNDPVLILYNPSWHSGVVGVVCSRLVRIYGKPVVVLGKEGERIKGSSRSVTGVNLLEHLEKVEGLLESWGGHPMAAGFTVVAHGYDAFKKAFSATFCDPIGVEPSESDCLPSEEDLQADLKLTHSDFSRQFLKELKNLGPFGVDHREPVFSMEGVVMASKVIKFSGEHFKFWVPLGNQDYDLMCLGWNLGEHCPNRRAKIDILFHLKWHEWRGRGYPQATLIDWKYSDS